MRRVRETVSGTVNKFRFGKAWTITRKASMRQWWSLDKLNEYSRDRASELIQYAAVHSQYYKTLFDTNSIDPFKMDTLNDWTKLPILCKDTLRSSFNSIITDGEFAKNAISNATGGSTGKPVEFLSDRRLYDMMAGYMNLTFMWAGWKPGELVFHIWGASLKSPKNGYFHDLRSALGGRMVVPAATYDEKTFENWWEKIYRFKPTILYVYPSVTCEFASWLEKKGRKINGIKGIFSSAEPLLPQQRVLMEHVFSCKVFNQYGSRETPTVACECEKGNMHIFTDCNIVEFIPDERENVSRIIITPLNNYAQPLLRYDIGDVGYPKEGKCECGRGYPLMEVTFGRKRDHLQTEDGRKIYPGFFTRMMDGKEWVKYFQFRQKNLNNIELLIEPVASVETEILTQLQHEIEPLIRKMMGDNICVSIRKVDCIEQTVANKYRYVINEIEKV